MLRRYPGSIINSNLKETFSASFGLFTPSTHFQYADTGTVIETPIFNTEYQSLIDSFEGPKYYISATGSDSNTGLTQNSALLTYTQFNSLTSTSSTPIMCIFLEGQYELSSLPGNTSTAECCINDFSYARTFVCQPGKVVFNWTANLGRRDASPLNFVNNSSRFYGGILKRNNNGRTLNYSLAFFNNTTNAFRGKVYNTVFQETNANGNWSLNYANSGFPSGTELNYCTFAVNETADASYTGTGLNLINCAGNFSYGTSGSTFTNWVTANPTGSMNATTYGIPGTSGIYNGTYSWPTP